MGSKMSTLSRRFLALRLKTIKRNNTYLFNTQVGKKIYFHCPWTKRSLWPSPPRVSRISVVRAFDRCAVDHSFDSCRGLRFFSLSHSRDMSITSFSYILLFSNCCSHISCSELKQIFRVNIRYRGTVFFFLSRSFIQK